MARPTTKTDLISAASNNYEKLNLLISNLTAEASEAAFDFSKDEKKKEAHWKRDKNLRDVLIHLSEWQQLIINWVNTNLAGEERPFLPAPYNWRTYPDLNVKFWEKHQDTPLEAAKEMLIQSHKEVMKLIEAFTNDELFSKNAFKWVGGSTLGSYFVSATASHYDWAMKKIRMHSKRYAKSK